MLHSRAFIGFIFSVITLLCIIPVQNENFAYANIEPKKGEKVLVEVAYENWAAGFQYKGTVILTDGSIYHFDASYIDKPMNDINPGSSLILDYLTKKIGDVSEEELKMIKKYTASVKANLTPSKHIAYDAGSNYTKVYDYIGNRTVLLQKTGDWAQLNTDKSTGNLRKIIEKYIPSSSVYLFFDTFVKPGKGEKVLVEHALIERMQGVDLRQGGDGLLHYGTVILTDGGIYKFDDSSSILSRSNSTIITLTDDGICEFEDRYKYQGNTDKKDPGFSVLTHLRKKIGDVSEEDLKTIKKYASYVEENLSQPIANIKGDITVYDYTGNRTVVLQKETANQTQLNTHESTGKLRKIINKYIPNSFIYTFVKPRKGEKVLVENLFILGHVRDEVTYYGTVIFSDGGIYEFYKRYPEVNYKHTIILDDDGNLNFDDSYRDKGVNDKKDPSSSILTHLIRKVGDVSEEDLKTIKKYASDVEENLSQPIANRNGDITVYDYTRNRTVMLQKTDNQTQLNTHGTADKLRQIIKKYLIEYNKVRNLEK